MAQLFSEKMLVKNSDEKYFKPKNTQKSKKLVNLFYCRRAKC